MGPHYREIDTQRAYRVPLTINVPPLLFHRVITGWPAVSRWSLDYFAARFPATMVRLERYDPQSTVSYLAQTAGNVHREVRFEHLRGELAADDPCYAVRENSEIFRQIPSLLDDLNSFRPFQVDAHCYKSLWIGPANYVTGMHADPGPTVVFQISGNKRFLLFEPSEADRVYAVNRSDIRAGFLNSSLKDSLEPSALCDLTERTGWADVQPFAPDFLRYPSFAQARGLTCALQPGDALYIPDGWWHAAMGMDLNISVATEPRMTDPDCVT